MDSVTNARRVTPQHTVNRWVDIELCPGSGAWRTLNREHGIQVLADISCNDHSAKLNLGRRVESSSISIDLLKNWSSACVCTQGAKCTPGKHETAPGFPLRLVDVRRRCIVVAPNDCEYVASSYTWGDPRKNKHLKLTKDTLSWPQSEGALSDRNEDVPTTIKDAFYVTDLLQERYLWVDAICIQQDDEGETTFKSPIWIKYSGVPS